MKTIIAGVSVGEGHPVRIMAALNVSPESFYKGSIKSDRSLARAAAQAEKDGADFIDVGAMSTAPYLKTQISALEESRRLAKAVRILKRAVSIPISIDTARREPALAGFEAGAAILNDVTGLANHASLGEIARGAQGVILMANPLGRNRALTNPVRDTAKLLRESLKRARSHGISTHHILLDPGIGFFRSPKIPWWHWDLAVLQDLKKLGKLPFLVGVSRKSFIGHFLNGQPADERLSGSLAITALAVASGASVIRTHDVKETKEAVRLAQAWRDLQKPFFKSLFPTRTR